MPFRICPSARTARRAVPEYTSAAGLVLGIPQMFEPRTGIVGFHSALVSQILVGAKRSHLKIDGGRRDKALVPEALLPLAANLVVADVRACDRLDGPFMADQPFEMAEHLTVPAQGLGLVGRVCLDMC